MSSSEGPNAAEVESLRATRDPDALTLESISNTLLAANRAGEDLIAEATQKAAQILAKLGAS